MVKNIYFLFQIIKRTQTKSKKKPKKKGRKKVLLLLTISVESLTGYDDIV